MSLTVIKLGGSLMQSKELPEWLDQISIFAKQSSIVIVPGGGKFADEVRTLQSQQGFDDVVAHQMALLAMAKYGYYLAGLNTDIHIVDDIDSVKNNIGIKKTLLWLPTSLIDDFTEIPASWEYTSDSIALWLAIKLQAENLLIVKSKTQDDADENYLDKGFGTFLKDYSGRTLILHKKQITELNQLL